MLVQKILIVEDSELLHRMYKIVLMQFTSRGTELLHAFNGQEALRLLATNPDVDLILLDVNMPVMSGLEFLAHRRAQRVFERIPVIMITTEGKESDTIRALELGAKAYLTKPFQTNDLLQLMGRVLGSSELDRQRSTETS